MLYMCFDTIKEMPIKKQNKISKTTGEKNSIETILQDFGVRWKGGEFHQRNGTYTKKIKIEKFSI